MNFSLLMAILVATNNDETDLDISREFNLDGIQTIAYDRLSAIPKYGDFWKHIGAVVMNPVFSDADLPIDKWKDSRRGDFSGLVALASFGILSRKQKLNMPVFLRSHLYSDSNPKCSENVEHSLMILQSAGFSGIQFSGLEGSIEEYVANIKGILSERPEYVQERVARNYRMPLPK